jgi:hypothetical protein
MKIMTNVARGLLIVGSFFLMSGTTLNAAKPERELEPYKIVDITEKFPAAAQTTAKIIETTTHDNAAIAAPAKKKASQTPKGVVYLPIVSLSSYVPIGAQILMMLLMIAVSGLFGAWLMFRELAKRVQILQENMPATVTSEEVIDSTPVQELFTAEDYVTTAEVIQAPVNPTPVKKRTLFVKQRVAEEQSSQLFATEAPESTEAKLTYAPPKPKQRGHLESKPEDGKSNRMPKNFLINEWFPVER